MRNPKVMEVLNLNYLGDLPVDCTLNAIFEPSNSNSTIVSISENCVFYFDCNTDEPRVTFIKFFVYFFFF